MKKLTTFLGALALMTQAFGGQPTATLQLAWVPGDNPTGTQHLLFWGTAAGVYTNLATPLVIPYSQTNCVVSNLVAGVRYYFVVQESDGVDVSVYSNEANGKTKLNPPKSLVVSP